MQKIVSIAIENPNSQVKEKELVKTFDKEFTTLVEVEPYALCALINISNIF